MVLERNDMRTKFVYKELYAIKSKGLIKGYII